MTPAERARAWYPSASSGGGNKDTASGTFLWKPVSDSNGKAAVHTPANVRIESIHVAGKKYTVGSYGNGYRPLFRLDKPGAAFGNGTAVHLNLYGGGYITVIIPNGAKRFEKSGFADHGEATAPPVKPPAITPLATSSIELPASYAGKVGLVAIVQGRKLHPCARDASNPARWMHPGKRASIYGVRWNVRPGGSVGAYNAGPFGLWSVFSWSEKDGVRFWTLDEIMGQLLGGTPVTPPAVPPVVVTPPPVLPSNKDAELTATGLRLAPDLAAIVSKVLILTNAKTPAQTVKYFCARSGNEWSTGAGLHTYPAAVYQIFWTKEPRIPHHQGFPGAIKNVSHVNQAGKWDPPSTRNP